MKKLPIDIQSFEVMRQNNYLYIDKTRFIHRMAEEGTFYFCSRPRRFGKSLLIGTLKAFFQGQKELFKDLWISKKTDWEWKQYPVILIDFNGLTFDTPDDFKLSLSEWFKKIAKKMA